jgi:hypothetical protein
LKSNNFQKFEKVKLSLYVESKFGKMMINSLIFMINLLIKTNYHDVMILMWRSESNYEVRWSEMKWDEVKCKYEAENRGRSTCENNNA